MKQTVLATLVTVFGILNLAAQSVKEGFSKISSPSTAIAYKKIKVDNVEIFYREGGITNKGTILFLHGFPTSSHMYRTILKDLSSTYHVIAPDYPGFGMSSSPAVSEFEYTFDHISQVMEHFIDRMGLKKLNLYMQDYGGPIGFRIAAKRPELIQSLLIQNANAYMEGLSPQVQELGKLQQSNDTAGLNKVLSHMLSYQGIKEQYLHDASNPDNISPDAYNTDSYFIEQKGIKDIQFALFKNYYTNFPKYDEWHRYLRTYQPPTLVMWGRNDDIFIVPGAIGYKKDLKNAELHLLNGGHFALEEHEETIASLIRNFLNKKISR